MIVSFSTYPTLTLLYVPFSFVSLFCNRTDSTEKIQSVLRFPVKRLILNTCVWVFLHSLRHNRIYDLRIIIKFKLILPFFEKYKFSPLSSLVMRKVEVPSTTLSNKSPSKTSTFRFKGPVLDPFLIILLFSI